MNQEILIIEEIITSNSPLSTSNTLESIGTPYIPVASGSGCTSHQENVVVEESITSDPLPSTSTSSNTLEISALPHLPVASGSDLTFNQETLIIEDAITSKPLLSTSPLSESIALPPLPFASGSSLTSRDSLLSAQESDQEEIILTASLAPLQEFNNDDDDLPLLPGAWFEESIPAESQQTLLLRSFPFQSLYTVYNTDHVFKVEHKDAPQFFEACAAQLAYQAGIRAGREYILQRDELLLSVRTRQAILDQEQFEFEKAKATQLYFINLANNILVEMGEEPHPFDADGRMVGV